ncbi:MAG: hypothetical protein ACREBH_02930 [Candidatus Micrarchaeaceae archaeon]
MLVVIALLNPISSASYTAKNLNVTIALNLNTSANVTETLHISISNESLSQYKTNRAALNLTLSDWQALIGPLLVQHVINPNSSVYNFKFFPGPVVNQSGSYTANITLEYGVRNVTFISETSPRVFQYRFNPKVLNFEHGESGEILNPNTTLTIVLPSSGVISTVYPIPDLPPYAFTTQYKNITQISWVFGEPLSKFTLIFTVKQSIEAEVIGFFSGIYTDLGLYSYVLISAAIILTILYIYRRAVS